MNRLSLEVIDVVEPCPAPWEKMRGEGAVRFCGMCRMNVYNLSEMPRSEAEDVVRQSEGRACVRFYRRADGTVATADCAPIRFAALRRTARRSVRMAAGLLLALFGLVSGLAGLRLSGVDLGAWFEDTAIGEVAKAGKKWLEPVAMEPAPVPEPPRPNPIEPSTFDASAIQGLMGDRDPEVWLEQMRSGR